MITASTRIVTQAHAEAAPLKARKMTLASVKHGKQERPFTALLYGTEGVGKSTWASEAPSPIFICAEDGTSHLDVARFDLCTSWDDIIECVDVLLEGGHEYKTVVIDTIDQAEKYAWDWLLANRKTDSNKVATSIEDYGYGKGYTAAIDIWRPLIAKLERLRAERGMNIILLAHSSVKSFTNPEGSNFDRYELSMNQKLAGMLKAWPDSVLFATYEVFAHTANGERKAKGVGSGARIVRTEKRPAFDAKNRYGLSDFYAYAAEGVTQQDNEGADLLAQIVEAATGTQYETKVTADAKSAAAANDTKKLRAIKNWLSAKLNEGTQS
jgi:hypothetical protein